VLYFKLISQHLPDGTEEEQKREPNSPSLDETRSWSDKQ
jgi:hypothetical protein